MPEGFPSAAQFGAASVLADGTLALGAADGQLYLLDRREQVFQAFQMTRDFIVGLINSHHGGLFVLSTSDIKHVSWPSPWLRVGESSGLVGSIRRVDTWQNRWLALSSSGALVSTDTGNPRQPVAFVSTGWTDFEAWDWLPLGPARGLLADSYQLFEISEERVVPLLEQDIMPRVLVRASDDPGLVYVGAELGLLVLRDTPDGWQELSRHEEALGLVTSLKELGPGDLLLATAYRGLHRIRLDPADGRLLSWQALGPDHGLSHRPESSAELARLPDLGIVLSSREGFLRWRDDRFEPVDLGGLGALRQPDNQLLLKAGLDDEIWSASSRQLWRRPAHGSWLTEDVAQLDPGPINSINRVNDSILIGGTGTLLLFERQRVTPERSGPGLRLSAVLLRARDDSWIEPQPLDRRPLSFRMDDEFIQFDFALPEYRRPDLTRTRYRLIGYADQFTEWGQSSRVSFSRLKPGPYRFEAEARSPAGVISRIEPFEFTIEPAWYRQRLLLALWVLLGVLGLIGLLAALVRWRLQRALAEQQRLAGMVDRRTAELAAANRKLESMVHVDGLTSIANRRRLEDYLEESWRQGGGELSVVILDVDHFKRYNDSFGHQAGDDALCEVARVVTACLRRSEDLVARYGGEEFVCVLPGTTLASARELAEHIRQEVESGPLGITVSIGIASARPADGGSLRELIEAADRNLYQAKQDGRNRVVG